jgi:hypothetical protein
VVGVEADGPFITPPTEDKGMSKFKLRTEDFKLSEEVAREMVLDFLEYYDIDIDEAIEGGTPEGRAVEAVLNSFVRYVRLGVLEPKRDDAGKMTVAHNTVSGKVLTYGEVSAKAKLVMARFYPKDMHSRTYAFMGQLCGLGDDAIKALPPRDLSAVETLGTVLMGA